MSYTEMEFLNINLTKDSSLQNPYEKLAKKENSSLFQNSILKNGKMRVENSSLGRLEFLPRNFG